MDSLERVVTAVELVVAIVALLVGIAVLTAVWVRRRRAGGVLIADSSLASRRPKGKS